MTMDMESSLLPPVRVADIQVPPLLSFCKQVRGETLLPVNFGQMSQYF